ncbi:MAG: hypothetical protein LKF87_12210 [Clostridium tyrobutyricum]|uniref:hypothetical protein n=1 Tax=Clostridium tyrobutyricum TaxID=1519 RepID=UPI00242A92CF|nr:hypothetical protein [Clostridium tyrobutyricum]MCH4200552.1 hypothetical protein [Clostridium tyrobutyricum]MCH4237600.1 hypothetical protein [Clostridium tyrobutyricum]MCH4259689.1 hypothetical protein [Clostridium tyrobutyricum]
MINIKVFIFILIFAVIIYIGSKILGIYPEKIEFRLGFLGFKICTKEKRSSGADTPEDRIPKN